MVAPLRVSQRERLVTACVLATGMLLVPGAWALCLVVRGLPWTAHGLLQAHVEVPILFGVDLYPALSVGLTTLALWSARRGGGAWPGARARLPSVAVALVRVGSDGRIEDLNPAAELVLGWAAGDARGRAFDVVVPELGPQPVLARTRRGEPLATTWHGRARHRDGTMLDVDVSLAVGEGGHSRVYVLRERDGRAASADPAARARLLEDVGTELRAPVNVALASCALALEEVRAGRGSVERDLRRIAASCERLRILADDMLDLARLQSQAVPTSAEEVDVIAVVRRVVDELDMDPERVVVDACPVPAVRTDPHRLARIVYHLVDHAVRAAQEEPVRVRVTTWQRMVCVDVVGAGALTDGLRRELIDGLTELIGAGLRGDARGTMLQLPEDPGWAEVGVDGEVATAPLETLDAPGESPVPGAEAPAPAAMGAPRVASIPRVGLRDRRRRRRRVARSAAAAVSGGPG